MRPRQMPRNFHRLRASRAQFSSASMRPRQMPRNFVRGAARLGILDRASMRPRQMPRNFPFPSADSRPRRNSFNEAAADAAEFYIGGELGELVLAGFNEAAADAAEFCDRARSEFRHAVTASMRPRQMPRNFGLPV